MALPGPGQGGHFYRVKTGHFYCRSTAPRLFHRIWTAEACFDGRTPGSESLLACAEQHRTLPIPAFVAALARDLFGKGSQLDDLTLLGWEVL
jgi:hypothetical protein